MAVDQVAVREDIVEFGSNLQGKGAKPPKPQGSVPTPIILQRGANTPKPYGSIIVPTMQTLDVKLVAAMLLAMLLMTMNIPSC